MTFKVEYSRRAASYVRRQSEAQTRRLDRRLELLAEEPFDPNLSIPLRGRAGVRRMRVGELRVLFEVLEAEGVILVVDVAPRGDVYKGT